MGTFANFLRALISEHEVSMRRIAEALEVSVPYVSQVANGHRPPFDASRIDKLSKLFPADVIIDLKNLAEEQREAFTPWANRTEDESDLLIALKRARQKHGHLDADVIAQIQELLAKFKKSM